MYIITLSTGEMVYWEPFHILYTRLSVIQDFLIWLLSDYILWYSWWINSRFYAANLAALAQECLINIVQQSVMVIKIAAHENNEQV